MVCSSRYGMPHEPPRDLSHQSAMTEWASSLAVCILSFWPCWEWWLDPSQPAIDGLALDQDDGVTMLSYAHVYSFVGGCAAFAQNNSTSVSLHLLSLSLILILNSLNHCQYYCALLLGFLWRSALGLGHRNIIKTQLNAIPVERSIGAGRAYVVQDKDAWEISEMADGNFVSHKWRLLDLEVCSLSHENSITGVWPTTQIKCRKTDLEPCHSHPCAPRCISLFLFFNDFVIALSPVIEMTAMHY